MITKLWAIGLIFIATWFGAFGSLFFKLGAKDLTFNLKKLIKNYKIIFGIILYGLGTIIFIPALKGGELSILYPLVSLSYIWATLLSIAILKEKMNKFKWLGIIIIIIGVILIGIGNSIS